MASHVPPVKNDPNGFVTYVSLVSQADTDIFQVNPTLAAGDVKIAINDDAPANLATLPAVDADFTKRVKVTLSQAETNGDVLTIIFSDAAGNEWCDLTITIHTTTQNLNTIDTVVDAIKAKTDNLPATPAPAGEYDTEMARITADVATEAKQDTIIGYIDTEVAAILAAVDTEIATLLDRLTAARAGYLDELGAANIPADIDTLIARLTAARAGYLDNLSVGAVALEATLTAIKGAGWTTETLKAIKDAIAALNNPTATAIADAILKRDIDQVEATAALHSLCTAILKAVSRIKDDAGTLKVYRTDGETLHMSQAITTDTGNEPIDELGVGA